MSRAMRTGGLARVLVAVPKAPVATVVLVAASVLYWKLRIIDAATRVIPSMYAADIYAAHYPMTSYAFSTLREGRMPLWNPYQLCGEPFLPIVYVGLFYPFNAVYLFLETGIATEVSFVLHMLLGGLGMWCLLRHFGVGHLGGLCAAVTYVWSGWLIFNANQMSLFGGMTWAPLTVLLFDLVAGGRRWAWLGLVGAVTCQVFLGALEVLLHTMYAASFVGAVRLVRTAWRRGIGVALTRGIVLSAAVAAGVLLAMPQILPTLELVGLSARAPGELSFEQVSGGGMEPLAYLTGALSPEAPSVHTVGFFPLLAAVLVIGFRKHRLAWAAGLGLAIGALLLVFGGPAYRLYYALPVGDLFRRPQKFLDLYTFGAALLAGVGVARLQDWSGLDRASLWRQPAWTATVVWALAISSSAALVLSARSMVTVGPYLIALLLVLVSFGLLTGRRWRSAAIVLLCLLHGVTMFFGTFNRDVRPSRRPDYFHRFDELFRYLGTFPPQARFYVFPLLTDWVEKIRAKEGTLQRVNIAMDYEPLSIGRYGAFFDRLSGRPKETPFIGSYMVGPNSLWNLMKLTGTRFFISYRSTWADRWFDGSKRWGNLPDFRLIYDDHPLFRVFEAQGIVPRAYLVPSVRVVSDPDEVLRVLESDDFDAAKEAVLEERPRGPVPRGRGRATPKSRVLFTRYEPEFVELEVEAPAAGFLVLTDLFYPGWKAFAGDRELPIHRANYLFRAVQLGAGRHALRFEYRPSSFRLGVWIGGATAVLVLLSVLVVLARRKRADVAAR